MKTELTSQNVRDTLMKCLFKSDEDTSGMIKVEGVRARLGLHPGRVEENKSTIEDMLSCLPDEFKKSNGGGWSFLNLCNDKNGEQWTGFHQSMDELVCLGLAIGKVSFLMPREMWDMLPGGMPYVIIND